MPARHGDRLRGRGLCCGLCTCPSGRSRAACPNLLQRPRRWAAARRQRRNWTQAPAPQPAAAWGTVSLHLSTSQVRRRRAPGLQHLAARHPHSSGSPLAASPIRRRRLIFATRPSSEAARRSPPFRRPKSASSRRATRSEASSNPTPLGPSLAPASRRAARPTPNVSHDRHCSDDRDLPPRTCNAPTCQPTHPTPSLQSLCSCCGRPWSRHRGAFRRIASPLGCCCHHCVANGT
mmetsp:Transcript_29441/g.84629  ORF Transcript_29441/g.84629 Transcript_29441/m.84629 type:complete len:234 (+) Transcript_29441:436-1137(+)